MDFYGALIGQTAKHKAEVGCYTESGLLAQAMRTQTAPKPRQD